MLLIADVPVNNEAVWQALGGYKRYSLYWRYPMDDSPSKYLMMQVEPAFRAYPPS
jgi:hypothetical protein